jgi:WD40 repeat protein/tRNA A-37 threonylcarbamoyl transferase component Bud32
VSDSPLATLADLHAPLARAVERICTQFEESWVAGGRPVIEERLAEVPVQARGVLLAELLRLELAYRRRAGEQPQVADYRRRFPDDAGLVEAVFALALRGKPAVAGTLAAEGPDADTTRAGLPEPFSSAVDQAIPTTAWAPGGLPQRLPEPERVPETRVPQAAPCPDGAALVEVPGYEILGLLGKGGMGVVYKARHQRLNRVVALKMILHGEHADRQEHRRFHAEAEAVARLQHPNVVQIFDVGECAGLPYFALEYCEGGSLADKLDGTPWEAPRAARLVETLARAMQAAHSAGLVHRDLKPANVLLAADGTLKVTDFGLVKWLDQQGRTQTGAVVGTPSYMAPEQAGGKKDVGPAADVYALGSILYELLVGRPPFKAATPLDTLLQVVGEEPVAVRRLQPQVPKDLETVCHKCLEKDPRKRYRSAEALAEDLRRFVAGEPVAARPVGVVGRGVRWARRRPAVAGLLGVVALVAAVGVAGIAWAYGEEVRQRNAASAEAVRAGEEARRADEEAGRAGLEAANARREAEAAKAARDEAERQTYFAQIGRADAHLLAADHMAASQVLFHIDPKYRGWEYGYLMRLTYGTPLTLYDGWGSVCYSPDGRHLASAARDHMVKIWDAQSGAEVLTLRGHTGPVESLSYSPDGTRLASAGGEFQKPGEVKIWDARSGAELLSLKGLTEPVRSVSYSPDGTRLAGAAGLLSNKLGEVIIWDAHTGARIRSLRGHTSAVISVSYSPDGTRLASASGDGTVKVWDAQSGAELLTLRGHSEGVTSVSYSPDGRRLASGSQDNTVKVWDARSGTELLSLRGHTSPVNSVRYSPDGARLASASGDRTVRLWDARTGADAHILRPHAWFVKSVSYSPDGTRVASGPLGEIKVWDARTGADLMILRGHTQQVWSLSYSPERTRVASASQDKTIKIWDTCSGVNVMTLRGHTAAVNCVSYSPDGNYLASASDDNTIKVWDARSGAELLSARGHLSVVRSVRYSPDGTRLASASDDNTVKVWDAHTGAELMTLRGHAQAVVAVSYSPDGTRLASTSQDVTVKIWNAKSGAELLTLRGGGTSVCYSPDGTRLACVSGGVAILDASSGAVLRDLRGHAGVVHAVCYSPDGTRLASASEDQTVKVWDARSGVELLTLRGHNSDVLSVSYSSDGTRLASASANGTIKVWDARSGGYDAWAEDLERRTAFAPAWHAEDAAAAEAKGDWFAVAFHRRWLTQLRPGEGLHLLHLGWAPLAGGDKEAYRRTCTRIAALPADGADLHPLFQLSAALTTGESPGGLHAAGGLVAAQQASHRAGRARAAYLVRIATLTPDSGVAAEDLLRLAREAQEAAFPEWERRELLGAALYRAGKPEEAIRELQEAVRLHGSGGSTWAKLFLALAYHRLGKAGEARAWHDKAQQGEPADWKERLVRQQLSLEEANHEKDQKDDKERNKGK